MKKETLNSNEKQRYLRHLYLEEVGPAGQQKLKEASILLVGVGGLGHPIAQYLAAAGVGKMCLVDHDRVQLSNLQRQILFNEQELGQEKAKVAAKKLRLMNPHIEIEAVCERFNKQNALNLAKGHDLILDGTDNFQTKYLINDVALKLGIPWIYGSIFKFEGQVSVFGMPDGPCYRCLYSQPPPKELTPNCAEAGVLGVLPGLIGSIQAMEAIKALLKMGTPLKGKILQFSGLDMEFSSFRLSAKKNCLCARPERINLEESFRQDTSFGDQNYLSIQEFLEIKNTSEYLLIDVREPFEHNAENLGGHNFPLKNLETCFPLLEQAPSKKIVLYCQSGSRGQLAFQILTKKGFKNIWNLDGGLEAVKAQEGAQINGPP